MGVLMGHAAESARAQVSGFDGLLSVSRVAGHRRGDVADIEVEDWGTLQADFEVVAQ